VADWLARIWIFVAFPLLMLFSSFAQNLLAPHEELGKFYLIVWRMFFGDITHFMIIFFIFLINYGLALFLTAPPHVMESNSPDGTWNWMFMLEDLTKLGLVGSELPVDFGHEFTDGIDKYLHSYSYPWGFANLGAFTLLYINYVLMSLILLLNLLIAMMGDTYSETDKVAKIEFRVAFARRVLLYETLAQIPPTWPKSEGCTPSFLGLFQLHAGFKADEDDDHDFYVRFKNVAANSEGHGTGGVRSTFDEDDRGDAPKMRTATEEQLSAPPTPGGHDRRATSPKNRSQSSRGVSPANVPGNNHDHCSRPAVDYQRSAMASAPGEAMLPKRIAPILATASGLAAIRAASTSQRPLVAELPLQHTEGHQRSHAPMDRSASASVMQQVNQMSSLEAEPANTVFFNQEVIDDQEEASAWSRR